MPIRLIKHYGFEHQLMKLAEQSSQLSMTILKYKFHQVNFDTVKKELAYTQLLIDQVTDYSHIGADVYCLKQIKVDELIKDIKNVQTPD